MNKATMTFRVGEPEPSNPISIFNHGQGFFLAGSRCLLQIDVGPGMMQCLTTAGVVNLCLSIELFAKSLLVAAGSKSPKTHKLDALFAMLPKADRTTIAVTYAKRVTSPKVDDLVRQASDYFVRLRYGYEFQYFNLLETPAYEFASAMYIHAARAHGIKVGVERIRS